MPHPASSMSYKLLKMAETLKKVTFGSKKEKTKANRFIEKNLVEYSRLRNFDFGPDKRSNVSCLSPYVTHGVISEVEIIKKSLKK